MTKTSGSGAGANGAAGSGMLVAGGAVAAVVVIGAGVFLAYNGTLGQGAQTAVARVLGQPVPGVIVAAPAEVSAPLSNAPSAGTQTAQAPATQEPEPTPVVQEPEPSATGQSAEPAAAHNSTADQPPAADPNSTAAAAPEAQDLKGPDTAAFVLQPPVLELARFDTDGSGIIAGAAQEGVTVRVLIDGEVQDEQVVDAGGEFVSFVMLSPGDAPRVLLLEAEWEGQKLMSQDSFILAATPLPEEGAPQTAPGLAQTQDLAGAPEVMADAGQAAAGGSAPVAEPALQTRQTSETLTGAAGTAGVQPVAPLEVADGAEAAQTPTTQLPSDTAPQPQVSLEAAQEQAEQADAQTTSTAPTGGIAQTQTAEAAPAQSTVQQLADIGDEGAQQDTAIPPAAALETGTAPRPEVAVTVLRAGQEGITLEQGGALPVPDKIALDTIGYTAAGAVELAGRAAPRSLVRVYLDNSAVTDIETRPDGRWSGELMAVAPGIYTLRLDELDPVEGKVLSRLETPFKREAPEVLQPAISAVADQDGAPAGAVPVVRAITVQKGDTLWAISQDRYGSGFLYLRVFDANRNAIRDPDLIYPGQVFALPE